MHKILVEISNLTSCVWIVPMKLWSQMSLRDTGRGRPSGSHRHPWTPKSWSSDYTRMIDHIHPWTWLLLHDEVRGPLPLVNMSRRRLILRHHVRRLLLRWWRWWRRDLVLLELLVHDLKPVSSTAVWCHLDLLRRLSNLRRHA